MGPSRQEPPDGSVRLEYGLEGEGLVWHILSISIWTPDEVYVYAELEL